MGGKLVEGMCTRDQEVCSKVVDGDCISYFSPDAWSRRGGCPLCSIPPLAVQEKKKKVNALKASKRKARGK